MSSLGCFYFVDNFRIRFTRSPRRRAFLNLNIIHCVGFVLLRRDKKLTMKLVYHLINILTEKHARQNSDSQKDRKPINCHFTNGWNSGWRWFGRCLRNIKHVNIVTLKNNKILQDQMYQRLTFKNLGVLGEENLP